MDKTEINNLLKLFPNDIPPSVKDEIKNLLPNYVFYEKKNYNISGYCTHCKQDFYYSRANQIVKPAMDMVYNKAKHNESGRCPICNKYITWKSENMGRTKLVDSIDVNVIVPISENEVGVIGCTASNALYNYRDFHMTLKTRARYYFSKDKQAYMWIPSYYYGFELRSSISEWNSLGKINSNVKDVYLINQKEIANTFLQYSQLEQYQKYIAAVNNNLQNYYIKKCYDILYLAKYTKYPSIEYLSKLGFNQLIKNIVNQKAKSRYINLKATSPEKVFNLDKVTFKTILPYAHRLTFEEIVAFIILRKTDAKLTIEETLKYTSYSQLDYPDIKNLMQLTKLSLLKINNYIDKNSNSNSNTQTLITWKDYIFACQKLELTLEDTSVSKPKNLKKAHDDAIDLIQVNENKEIDEKIVKIVKKKQALEYTTDTLLIRLPLSSKEIIEEGSILKHCAKRYVEQHSKNVTTILFIRKTDEPDKPFYTLELNNKKEIVQVKGYRNRQQTPEVRKFVDEWFESIVHKSKSRNKKIA